MWADNLDATFASPNCFPYFGGPVPCGYEVRSMFGHVIFYEGTKADGENSNVGGPNIHAQWYYTGEDDANSTEDLGLHCWHDTLDVWY